MFFTMKWQVINIVLVMGNFKPFSIEPCLLWQPPCLLNLNEIYEPSYSLASTPFICQQEKQRPPSFDPQPVYLSTGKTKTPPLLSPNLYICQHEIQGPTFDPHSLYFLARKTKTLLPILERSTITLWNSKGFRGTSWVFWTKTHISVPKY